MALQVIQALPGFEEWRCLARKCLQDKIHPHQVTWKTAGDSETPSLFAPRHFELAPGSDSGEASPVFVPKAFLNQAAIAACHRDPNRYGLLYKLLWRLAFENKNLLQLQTDDDVMHFNQLIKAVQRDAYKIKAFLRFREVEQAGEAHFVSWYEPEHYSLELALPFFQTRFKNMRWSILTPYRCAHWDRNTLTLSELSETPPSGLYPESDSVEGYWLTYYEHTFNPARIKTRAMLSQMPKKYWKNMPETALVAKMLQNAEGRLQKMLNAP
ncbi:TIGR03915 family putative DNA repair protein [Vampirovibrio sp.]|uniref:TIGR03915 family putative DNA repair protein n=1 Tax=Vampirovibrio sp. TaxID=2717857 RepID=UPI0035943BE5